MSTDGPSDNKVPDRQTGAESLLESVHEDISDAERAEILLEYTDSLPCEPLLVPLWETTRGPKIPKGGSIDDAEKLTPRVAASRIRDWGVRGFYIYAGVEEHNTGELLFCDRDQPSKWPDTPETLRVISGGDGPSDHLTYRNDGSVRGAAGKDDLENAGSIHVKRQGVVAPGSKHHETGNVYRVVENHGVKTLSADDLPPELQPRSNSGGGNSYIDPESKEVDENNVAVVQAAIRDFRCGQRVTRRARNYLDDLRKGENYIEHGFKADDGTGDRSEANLSLASKLYGVLLMAGEEDDGRNREMLKDYLVDVARRHPYTDDGQRRKLLLKGTYLGDTITAAIESFEVDTFRRWCWKKEWNDTTSNDYGDGRYEAVYETADLLTGSPIVEDGYPSRDEIAEFTRLDEEKPLTFRSYQEIVSRHPRLRKAKLGHNEFVYYPSHCDDPEEAEYIQYPGDETKYEPGTLGSWTPEVIEQ